MATRFQQLGAFVIQTGDVSDDRLDHFAAIGGKWIVPVLAQLGYPADHDPDCVHNLAGIEAFKRRCSDRGISCGGWFNGWNGGELHTNPSQDAQQVADIVKPHNLGPIVLDLESAYQGNPTALPALIYEVRRRIITREIVVSTNSPNDSMPWNGHALWGDYRGSMRRLNVKLAPQWYPWMGQWGSPVQTMQWIQAHGTEDNFHDPTYANQRAVALSMIHGTLEATGVEGAALAPQLVELEQARAYGYTTGLSLYVLEQAPDSDLDLIAQHRGRLYLV